MRGANHADDRYAPVCHDAALTEEFVGCTQILFRGLDYHRQEGGNVLEKVATALCSTF
jgi:hypothetical protein